MERIKRITKNALFQYSVISFLLSALIGLFVCIATVRQFEHQLVVAHGNFYQAYIDAIEVSYPEIIPLLDQSESLASEDGDEKYNSDSISPHNDFHTEKQEDNDPWIHFYSDLQQFPSVEGFRISNKSGEHLRQYHPEVFSEGCSTASERKIKHLTYKVLENDLRFQVCYRVPIVVNDQIIGYVDIIDGDGTLQKEISQMIEKIFLIVSSGWLIFFISLFLLFFRIYRKQNAAISNLDKSQALTIYTMSKIAELKDDNTGAHINRTSIYCRILAGELSKEKQFRKYLKPRYIKDLEQSAPLHDIGKVGIPDHILLKPGKLTKEEFNVIKTHPILGAKVLEDAVDSLGFRSFFEIGYQIVLYHHENWDGTGYPSQLAGEEIPLSARIMALADVYDALRTERPYKEAFSHKKAMEIILEQSGTKFDPAVVAAFKKAADQFEKTSETEDFSENS